MKELERRLRAVGRRQSPAPLEYNGHIYTCWRKIGDKLYLPPRVEQFETIVEWQDHWADVIAEIHGKRK